ncbi:MAG TPA: TRAP transporter large permease [Burkholderiales bacterium]|nr:TRAP transporter large permease [Burkholderiales bacterium]
MLALLFVAFLLALLIGFDVGFSMIFSAWLGILAKPGEAIDTAMMPLSMIAGVDSYALVQVPLFILAGELMNSGGLTMRLIDWAMMLVGRLKGSLGHVSIITNFVMAGVSGSAVADAVATGKPLIPAMRNEGYGEGFAGAVIVAGALLGPILPPSIPMVVYAQISSQSVVKLFMAGVLPAILLAAGFLVICSIVARYRKYASRERVDFRSKLRATGRASWALMMPVIVIGGIRFGLLTVTESAAVAVLYALVVSFVVYRGITLRQLPRLIFHAGRSTAIILFLLAAAGPFSWLVAESQINQTVIDTIRSVSTNPVVVLLIVNLFLLLIGCIVEPLPAMIIFLPLLIPLGAQVGIDPIQFGAVVVLNLMIGLMHPPIGLLLFVVSSVGKLRLAPVMWEVLPFLGWAILILVLTIVFPPITTWLPSQIR